MSSKSLNFRRSRLRDTRAASRIATGAQIARIDALTSAGRANWFALLAYLAFALITTLGVDDIDFFVDSRQTQLPLVGVSIPTFSFFVFAPILGAALYAYLHLHIRKVSEALAEAPPGEPPLEESISPWLLNDFILRQRRDGAIRPRPLDRIANLATLGLVWLAPPLVLALMWWRTWPAHTPWLTALCGVTVIVSIYIGLRSWWKMRRDARRETRFLPPVRVTAALAAIILARGYLATSGLVPPITNPKLPMEIVQYGLVERADLRGARIADLPLENRDHVAAHLRYRRDWCALRAVPDATCRKLSTPDALPPRFDVAAFRACAETGELSTCFQRAAPPPDTFAEQWTAFRNAEIDALSRPDLSRRDLTGANLEYSALVGVDLFSSDLRNTSLYSARMERADLRSSDLSRTKFHNADLRGALFFWTKLDRARFSGAALQGAQFNGATGERVGFNSARLDGANLDEVVFPKAGFTRASLDYARIYRPEIVDGVFSDASLAYTFMPYATLTGGEFQIADLTGATLTSAHLDKAYLFKTRFLGTIVDYATFSGARFDEATMQATLARDADFRGAKMLTQSMLDGVVGNSRTLLPETADPATGAALHTLSCLPRATWGWEHLAPAFWRQARSDPADAADLLGAVLCAADEEPRETGAPWPVDQSPPWEQDTVSQAEDRQQ